jgi:multidrug efflux pump subunit AcrB
VSRLLIRRSVIALLILGAFALLAGGLGKKIPSSFVPEEDQGYFYLNVQLPDASSLQRTDDVCRKVEKILAETKGVKYYNTVAGFSLLSYVSATYNGFYFVSLEPWDERDAAGPRRQDSDRQAEQAVPVRDPGGVGLRLSCRRRSPASAPPAGSRSGCRTGRGGSSTS